MATSTATVSEDAAVQVDIGIGENQSLAAKQQTSRRPPSRRSESAVASSWRVERLVGVLPSFLSLCFLSHYWPFKKNKKLYDVHNIIITSIPMQLLLTTTHFSFLSSLQFLLTWTHAVPYPRAASHTNHLCPHTGNFIIVKDKIIQVWTWAEALERSKVPC